MSESPKSVPLDFLSGFQLERVLDEGKIRLGPFPNRSILSELLLTLTHTNSNISPQILEAERLLY